MKNIVIHLFLITSLFFLIPSGIAKATESLYEIAYQTYIYAYPIVLMKSTQIKQNVPVNQFLHYRELPLPSDRDIVRWNRDTLYSMAWLNLSDGPVLLTVPKTGDRYYLLQILDMWTDTFAGPSSRTTGSEEGQFLIVGPNWDGQISSISLPNIDELVNSYKLIKSPTNQVWIVGRTEIGDEDDYSSIHEIQDGYHLEQISDQKVQSNQKEAASNNESHFLKIANEFKNGALDPPQVVAQMEAATFFEIFTELMIENPPHIQDWPIVALMSQIGITPGKALHFESLDENVQGALNQAVQDALKDIHVQTPIPFKDYWRFMPMFTGSYGANYMFRAAIAFTGLGANLPEDAVYPVTNIDCNSEILDGSKNYVVHFEKDQIPPTNAFWSLTVYDSEIYLIENPIHRYNLTSRQNVMKLNPDGSLDIYLQDSSPGVEWESNWLPIPSDEPFSITLRIYWPKREVLEGIWKLPKVCPR
jgi:hypothetical protein